MTGIDIAKGFMTYRQNETSKSSSGKNSSAGFMQTLSQTESDLTNVGKTDNKPLSSLKNTDSVKTENTPSASNNNGGDKTENVTDSSVSGGSVKLDEEAVKELEQLKGTVQSENSAAEASGSDLKEKLETLSQTNENSGKSHLEQAEEALKNAILKAFNELNDPSKDLEEFEEKILTFLLKLVNSINGKTDEDISDGVAADSDKEDEEGLGGVLVQMLKNMLENVRKNAEMSAEAAQAAQEQAPLGANPLTDTATDSSTVSDSSAVNAAKPVNGYYEQAYLTENANVGENIDVSPSDVVSNGEKTALNLTNTAEKSDNSALSKANGQSEQLDLSRADIEGLNTALSDVTNRSNAETVRLTPNQMPTTGEENPESASLFNGATVNHSTADAALSFNETDDNSSLSSDYLGAIDEVTAGNQASSSDGETKTSLSPVLPETTQVEASKAGGTARLPETENAVYEQLAMNVYKEVEQTFKAAKETSVKPVAANNAEQNAENTENTAESEFDELTQLLGLKKNTLSSENGKSDNPDNADNFADSGKNSENDIFFSDIKLVSSKETEQPVLENVPTGGAVDRVVTQVVNRIMASIPQKGEETSLIVTLDPESLGKISIKLVENAGKISVTITAENRETAAMLSSRAENVQESMRDQGTQLEKYQVVCSAEQDGRSEQQNYEGSSKNPYVRNIDEEGDDDGEFEEILRGAV